MGKNKNLTIDETFNLAAKNHQENKTDIAQELYNQVLKVDPNHLGALNNLGAIFKSSGEYQKAKSSYEKAIELNPNLVEAHYNRGNIFRELKDFEKAKDCYEKVIQIDPSHKNANYNLGIIFQKLGENQRAKDCYEKVIKINPSHVDAYNNLGNIFLELGNHQRAKDCYEKAIEINPNYVDAYNNLGNIFQELKENQKAKIYFEKLIKINPNYVDAYNKLGVVFKNLGEYQKAKECYDKVIEINPNSQEALINRGKILFEKGEFELSLIDFDNCNNFDSRSCALTSLYALGNIDEIYKRIEENSQLDEKNIKVAAFSSFIAYKEKKNTTQNFCPNPIDFIHHSNLSSHLQNFNSFITEVIKELHNVNIAWEPFNKSTIGGFQSKSNLFTKPQNKIQNLKSIIITEIESYYLKFINETCSFIKRWPSKYDLRGWQVILKKLGHQGPHIHSSGWLSGVIYLKVVPSFKKNEGAIEFSLNGEQYFDAKSPKIVHLPKTGDIVLFPSSLHHRTIPFSADTDRISIAFDLVPNLKKNYRAW
jgi:tetratricopeptide (TPR) repeat protein